MARNSYDKDDNMKNSGSETYDKTKNQSRNSQNRSENNSQNRSKNSSKDSTDNGRKKKKKKRCGGLTVQESVWKDCVVEQSDLIRMAVG